MGGFGLFSTVDKLPLRTLRIYVKETENSNYQRLRRAPELRQKKSSGELYSLISYPSDQRLQGFIDEVSSWDSLKGYRDLKVVIYKAESSILNRKTQFRIVNAIEKSLD